MKFKNIIFDFGNVIVKFDEKQVLGNYCSNQTDFQLMKEAVFYDWDALDGGAVSYDAYMEHAATLLPERLRPDLQNLAKEWYRHLTPLQQTWELIHDLKKEGFSLYILSNASTFFAEKASFFEITKEFDGLVFSGPINMQKPEPEIYKHLFTTYALKPEECLFLDDKEENISAGKALGMDGIIFTGDIKEVNKRLNR